MHFTSLKFKNLGAWPWIAQIGYLSNSGTGHKSYLCGKNYKINHIKFVYLEYH